MRALLLATALALGTTGFAAAQSSIATAPANNSTGATVPDTRQVDQGSVNSSITAPSTKPSTGTGSSGTNWRSSSGLNADPSNPNGAPGPSGLGSSIIH